MGPESDVRYVVRLSCMISGAPLCWRIIHKLQHEAASSIFSMPWHCICLQFKKNRFSDFRYMCPGVHMGLICKSMQISLCHMVLLSCIYGRKTLFPYKCSSSCRKATCQAFMTSMTTFLVQNFWDLAYQLLIFAVHILKSNWSTKTCSAVLESKRTCRR